MASRKKKAASAGAVLAGVGLAVGLVWLATRDDAPEKGPAGDKGDAGTEKPEPTYTPDPPPPPPPPTLAGSWCSSVPSPGAPPGLDEAIQSYVLAQPEPRLVYLWLGTALYVMGFADAPPTLAQIQIDSDTTGFSVPTRKGLESALRYEVTEDRDKQRVVADAFRAFVARDKSRDKPCPASVKPELNTMLNNWVADVTIANERGELP